MRWKNTKTEYSTNFPDIYRILVILLFWFGMPVFNMEHNKHEHIPKVITLIIFRDFDGRQLCITSLVCKEWCQIINDGQLWNSLYEKHFGKHIGYDRPSFIVAKKYSLRMEGLLGLVENINSFSWEKLDALLNEEDIENDLLKYLELRLLRLSLTDTDVEAKNIVSFLIANHVVNISQAKNALQNTLRKISWTKKDDSPIENIDGSSILMAFDASAAASSYGGWYNAFATACSSVDAPLSKKCFDAANKAFQLVSIHPAIKQKMVAKVALIISLIESSHEGFQNRYFLKAYKAAHKILIDDHFDLSISETIVIIAKNTWKKSNDIANLSYIASLKRMLEANI